MIKDKDAWREWEKNYIRKDNIDWAGRVRLMDSMYEHARKMGRIHKQDPLEGLDHKIQLARVLNSL